MQNGPHTQAQQTHQLYKCFYRLPPDTFFVGDFGANVHLKSKACSQRFWQVLKQEHLEQLQLRRAKARENLQHAELQAQPWLEAMQNVTKKLNKIMKKKDKNKILDH